MMKYLTIFFSLLAMFFIASIVQAEPQIGKLHNADFLGKCFKTITEKNENFEDATYLCFEEDLLNHIVVSHSLQPNGRWMAYGVSGGWEEWYVEGGELYLREEKGERLNHCEMHLKDKVLTFGRCLYEIPILQSTIWSLDEE